MSEATIDGLKDLLAKLREHPAFPMLLKQVEVQAVKQFRPSASNSAAEQNAEWIFRSGQQRQHEHWHYTLTQWIPGDGNNQPSQQEKS